MGGLWHRGDSIEVFHTYNNNLSSLGILLVIKAYTMCQLFYRISVGCSW